MSTVTKIEELSKSRSKVYLDGSFAFVLYKGELRRYEVKEGAELKEAVEQEICQVLLPKRAKLRCMNLLQSREYTEKQLIDKLRQGCYPEAAIEEALQYVKSFHYVDDERYAEQYIRCHITDKSRQRIKMDLARKGIDKKQIERKLAEAEFDAAEEDQQNLLKSLLLKKHYESDLSLQEKQKIFAFLMRRGFTAEDIRKAMNLYEESDG